ncbi:peamaclein-like [Ananas comosus]|uniref:Peamaclein-like n=1 Tax=Ananas comosus TaxID=4615 RepID=A0A199UKY8_ANACO|nr:peamaclein-like [Ananas comosus]OAY65240.1 Snakin-1 [Ananas comosus]OAY72470.1 Snakin-1 [Ananas comosus]
MKLLPYTLALILLLLLTSSYLQATMALSDFCNSKCQGRCAKAGKTGRCMRYCGMCCEQCKCVPSGTYGNKDECPCYRDMVSWKTKRPKCP